MNIAEWLNASGRVHAKAPALLRGTEIVADYRELSRRCAALAAMFSERYRIRPGDRVAVFMKNRTEYMEALFAIWWAGAAAVPINAKLHPREAGVILDDSGASLVILAEETERGIAEIRPDLPRIRADDPDWVAMRSGQGSGRPVEREDDDLAWLFYTSGTTGRPKGVMLTHANLVAASLCYPIDVDPVLAEDATLYAAPMSHGAGLYSFVHVRAGARHVVPVSGGFDADEILELAPQLGNVSLFAAPTMVRRLVDVAKRSGARGEGIKTITYGGGPMYLVDIEEAVDVMGPRFVQIYGQGESPMCITALSRSQVADRETSGWQDRLGSVGVAQSCVSVRIGGADGSALPAGEVGEVMVRGPQVMAGYWNNPKATAETLAGGWLHTGDLGRLDEDGFLTLTDRSKDVIISGGTNIYPREVEEALLLHPDVVEASVVGRRHPDWGEEVVAFVALREGTEPSPEALDRHCADLIARFKRPREYRFMPDLPKNNYGKIVKTELRELLAASDPT